MSRSSIAICPSSSPRSAVGPKLWKKLEGEAKGLTANLYGRGQERRLVTFYTLCYAGSRLCRHFTTALSFAVHRSLKSSMSMLSRAPNSSPSTRPVQKPFVGTGCRPVPCCRRKSLQQCRALEIDWSDPTTWQGVAGVS